MVTMGPDNDPNSFEGYSPGACARRLAEAGVEIVGVNCMRSPGNMLPVMEEMRDAVAGSRAPRGPARRVPRTAKPAQLRLAAEFPYELEKITLPSAAFGEFAVRAREMGYGYIGSCCGSVAAHVREMARGSGQAARRGTRVALDDRQGPVRIRVAPPG